MTNAKDTYNFMLFGKTGAGKSSTGNTLLDRSCFERSISWKSCTQKPVLESREFDEYVFSVVDTSGVCDMNKSTEEILQNFHEGMCLIPEGFNALLFVMKLGERYTNELLETINVIKASFGEEKLNDVCIFAITNGEDGEEFKVNNQEIQQWLKNKDNVEENSKFEKFLQECNYRAVVFYNKTADKRKESVKKLLGYLRPHAPRYTNEHFQKCAATRDAIVTSLNFPAQKADIQKKLSLLKAEIEVTWKDSNKRNVDKVSAKIDNLVKGLETDSKETDSMHDIKKSTKDWKLKLENLPEDEKEKVKVLKAIGKEVDNYKTKGATVTTIGVITGGAGVATLCCTLADVVGGTAGGYGLTAAIGVTGGFVLTGVLGVVTCSLIPYGIYLAYKGYKASKNKKDKEDKEKLL